MPRDDQGAVPGKVAETTPTQRDRHLQSTAQYGRMGWQASSEVAPNDAGSTTEVPSNSTAQLVRYAVRTRLVGALMRPACRS